jgi:hypothetical protein
MEQAHRSAMAHHDHWSAQMGTWVMINAAWYYRLGSNKTTKLIKYRHVLDISFGSTGCAMLPFKFRQFAGM